MTPAAPLLTAVAARPAFSGVLALLAAIGEPAWVVDAARCCVLAANLEAEELFGRGELEGLDAEDVIPDLEDIAYWDGVRCGSVGTLETEAELHLPGGRTLAVVRRIAPLWLADGTALYLVQVRDRTHERRVERERETALAELRATLEAIVAKPDTSRVSTSIRITAATMILSAIGSRKMPSLETVPCARAR